MLTSSYIGKTATISIAAALMAVMTGVGAASAAGTAATAYAKTSAKAEVVVATAQKFKKPTRGTRPVAGPQKMTTTGSGNTANSSGCHDGASQTSYEGSCDYHEEYEATGGCESDTTGTSYPGNCANSSEP